MKNKLKKLVSRTPIVLGLAFIIWGLLINKLDLEGQRDIFTDLYYFIPLLGGAAQFLVSKTWGGNKSYIGKSFMYFSIALFAEGLGLLIYSLYFRLVGEELAYPSAGDYVFVAGIVSLIIGSYWLLKVIAPTKKQLVKPVWHIAASLLLVAILFAFAWGDFLKEGITDERGGVTVLFNVIYPTTELVYIGLCMMSLLKVSKTAGGKMFKPVLSILAALCLLYVSDFIFLRRSYNDTWVAAGLSDMLYVTSYTAIVWSLHYFDSVRFRLTSSRSTS